MLTGRLPPRSRCQLRITVHPWRRSSRRGRRALLDDLLPGAASVINRVAGRDDHCFRARLLCVLGSWQARGWLRRPGESALLLSRRRSSLRFRIVAALLGCSCAAQTLALTLCRWPLPRSCPHRCRRRPWFFTTPTRSAPPAHAAQRALCRAPAARRLGAACRHDAAAAAPSPSARRESRRSYARWTPSTPRRREMAWCCGVRRTSICRWSPPRRRPAATSTIHLTTSFRHLSVVMFRTLDVLLRRPEEARGANPYVLLAGAVLCYVLYGLAAGFFQGGWSLGLAVMKVPLIILGSIALCIPSLYVFSALAGAEYTPRTFAIAVAGFCACRAALLALMPVIWLFSVSTISLDLCGCTPSSGSPRLASRGASSRRARPRPAARSRSGSCCCSSSPCR